MSAAAPDDDLTCRELVELVTAWLEGVLPAVERARFELHLAQCQGCRAYLRQLEDTIRVAGRLSEPSLPGTARDALLRAFRGWKTQGLPL
jgi:anti-sigma factor RsiW